MGTRGHPDEDLDELLGELTRLLEQLDDRLESAPARRASFLRFTERYAIPAAIAGLEANIQALEAIAGAIRIAQGRDTNTPARDNVVTAVERVLADASDAVAGTPTDPEAERLLTEARALREEIRTRIDELDEPHQGSSAARERPGRQPGATEIPVAAESESSADIDVDEELDRLRDEVDRG